jgi:hypothetical protein
MVEKILIKLPLQVFISISEGFFAEILLACHPIKIHHWNYFKLEGSV